MKILHIATDEKFINSINWQFKHLELTSNKFIILVDSIINKIKYVTLESNFTILEKNNESVQFCLDEIKKHEVVIFHGLNYFQSRIVLKLTELSNVVWFFWGGEFYDNPKGLKASVIGSSTKSLMANNNFRDKLLLFVRPLFYYLKYGTNIPERSILKAAKKIKNFGVLYLEEMQYFKSVQLLSHDAALFTMTYYPLEYVFQGKEDVKINGFNILLGNSASSTNNHVEAFDILRNFNLGERKLIMPLSYGDTNYGEKINEIGKNIFGDSLFSIFDFMTLNKYNELLRGCSIVIMNHYRQQAVGNILAMLWMGSKIYLNESNNFYHYLKRIGIHVFSIDKDLTPRNPNALVELNENEVSHNKCILIKEIGFKSIKEKMTQNLYSIVENGH